MSATNTDTLTERIRDEVYGTWVSSCCDGAVINIDEAAEIAADLAPIIAAEVRKAQADAWGEGQASGWNEAQEQWQINGMVGGMWKHADTPNPYREQEA